MRKEKKGHWKRKLRKLMRDQLKERKREGKRKERKKMKRDRMVKEKQGERVMQKNLSSHPSLIHFNPQRRHLPLPLPLH